MRRLDNMSDTNSWRVAVIVLLLYFLLLLFPLSSSSLYLPTSITSSRFLFLSISEVERAGHRVSRSSAQPIDSLHRWILLWPVCLLGHAASIDLSTPRHLWLHYPRLSLQQLALFVRGRPLAERFDHANLPNAHPFFPSSSLLSFFRRSSSAKLQPRLLTGSKRSQLHRTAISTYERYGPETNGLSVWDVK